MSITIDLTQNNTVPINAANASSRLCSSYALSHLSDPFFKARCTSKSPKYMIRSYIVSKDRNVFSVLDSLSSSMTLNEVMNRLRYQIPGLRSMSIRSLNTSHPVPIHASDSQKYYLIIGGKRRLIPDIQTLRYLEHKYNFNENRDVLSVPYSQIAHYPDGGSFTSVVASTRQAQQELANLFSATQKDYAAVMSASTNVSSMISQASMLQSQYKNALNMATTYYNNAVSLYNKGKQSLSNKAPYAAESFFRQAKSINSQAQTYANQAKAYLSQLNGMKSNYVSTKNNLISLKQKYQAILGTIAKQLGLATSNEFVKADPSGLAQIQSTGSMAQTKANSSISTINSALEQLASMDITKVSMSDIANQIAKISTQGSAIDSAVIEAQKEAAKLKAQQQAVSTTTPKSTVNTSTNTLPVYNTNQQQQAVSTTTPKSTVNTSTNTLPVYNTNQQTTTQSPSLLGVTTQGTQTGGIFSSLDTAVAKELPESLKPYAKYTPYAMGALLLLLLIRR